MAQDENNASEYKQLALYLVSEFFVDHRNKDVRLLVACCIADIFRVFAPEAPFTDSDVVKVWLPFNNYLLVLQIYVACSDISVSEINSVLVIVNLHSNHFSFVVVFHSNNFKSIHAFISNMLRKM